jgi:DNA-directed RNA polymerase subunit RPC12/RpoP
VNFKNFLQLGGIVGFIGFLSFWEGINTSPMNETLKSLGGILIIIGFAISFKGLLMKNLLICGYCGFKTSSQKKIHNHTLTCEKYQLENNSKEIKSPASSALDILKEKYEKGIISKEEFDSMKKDLEESLSCDYKWHFFETFPASIKVAYVCLECKNKHDGVTCPKCGSKMHRADF